MCILLSEGTLEKDCPNKDKKNTNENVVRNEDKDQDIALIVSSSVHNPDKWILNSGCSYNMSPNRDWFSALRISIDEWS